MSVIEAALKKVGGGLVAASGVGLLVSNCIYTVDAGQRGLIFSRFGGVQDEVRKPGIHFLVPWLQRADFFDVRSRPYEKREIAQTNDQQNITLGVRVLTRPNEAELATIYKEYGFEQDQRVLQSIIPETTKQIVAQHDAQQLITLRDQVSADMRSKLTQNLKQKRMLLDDVAITHLSFSPDYTRAIEAKQVALQNSKRAGYVVQKTEQERQVQVIEAEAESEAARLIQEATAKAGYGVVQLRKLEACKDIADQLSRSRNIVYLPGGGADGAGAPNILIGMSSS